MTWLLDNWDSIAGIVLAVLSVASMVTKMTPTPKDDEFVRKVVAFLSFLQPKGTAGLKRPLSSPAPSEEK